MKFFGTDGVRGVANSYLTPDLAFRLGQGYGCVLRETNLKSKVIIGTDTRISKDLMSNSVIAGMLSVGVDVMYVGVLPTPGIANLIDFFDAQGGVVISASHNSYEDNGIKFFNEKGFKLDDSLEEKIETHIGGEIDDLPTADAIGKLLANDMDFKEIYVKKILNSVDLDLSGYKIALDCANGSGYEVAPKVYECLGADVRVINNHPNGTNINYNCGSTHIEGLQKFVVENSCDIGIAFDGDADRVLCVDELGNLVDGDMIIGLCAKALKEEGKLKNSSVVLTVMSNLGIHKYLEDIGCKVFVSNVGDRYVIEKMLQKDAWLGGEQSGHIIFLDSSTTGDGLLSSVQFLNVLAKSKKALSSLVDEIELFPQILENVRVPNDKKKKYLEYEEIKDAIEKAENSLGSDGRVLIRPSGTEPLVRVMVEGKDVELIKSLALGIISVIEKNLGC